MHRFRCADSRLRTRSAIKNRLGWNDGVLLCPLRLFNVHLLLAGDSSASEDVGADVQSVHIDCRLLLVAVRHLLV